MASDKMTVPPLDIDSSSTMDISDLNEFFSPDWTDIEISPFFSETEIIAVATGTTTTEAIISADPDSCGTFGKLKKLDADNIETDLKTCGSNQYGSSNDISMQDHMTSLEDHKAEELDHSSTSGGATTTGEFKCNNCSKTFRYKSKYNDHMLIHSGLKQFSCSDCGKSFALKHHLKDHARTHKREKPFKCQVCSKKFCDKNYFTLHVLKHRVKDDVGLKLDKEGQDEQNSIIKPEEEEEDDNCITDDQVFIGSNMTEFSKTMNKSSKTISMGDDNDDDDSKSFSCDICSKSFKVKGQLVKHVLIHSKQIPCLVCSNVYSQHELRLHMKTAHSSDSKPFKCDACSKSFRKKSQLNQHLLYHNGQAPHSCDMCGKKFTDRVAWVRHVQTHEGIKPFKCQLCYKSFSLKSNLKVHLITTHSGLKRFTCEICEKNFSRKGDLIKHNQSHLVDKPHLCEHCGKSFSRNYNLKLHYRNYHSELSNNGSNDSIPSK